jgi:hypothetical protein
VLPLDNPTPSQALPTELSPDIRCDCPSGVHDGSRVCRGYCICNKAWSVAGSQWHPDLVYDVQHAVPVQHRVYQCTGCGQQRKYNGHDGDRDGVFCYNTFFVSFALLLDYDQHLYNSGETFTAFHGTRQQWYAWSKQKFLTMPIFRSCWWEWLRRRSVNVDQHFLCPACDGKSDSQLHLIWDGVSLGVQPRHLELRDLEGCAEAKQRPSAEM